MFNVCPTCLQTFRDTLNCVFLQSCGPCHTKHQPACNYYLVEFFRLWRMRSEMSNTFSSVSIGGLPDLGESHTEPASQNF